MAKVKCVKCGEAFDREKVPFVKIQYGEKNRYAHAICPNGTVNVKEDGTKKEDNHFITEDAVLDFVKKVLEPEYALDAPKIQKQIKNYVNKGMTVEGILSTLKYCYTIKENNGWNYDKEGLNEYGISIVPYFYQEAKQYYTKVAKVRKTNKEQEINPQTTFITIKTPKRIPNIPREWRM